MSIGKKITISMLVTVVTIMTAMVLYVRTRVVRPEVTMAYIDISRSPKKGSPAAPVTIIEFADFECPFCSDHANNVLPSLHEDYISTGKVQYVFMNFPLPKHEFAPKAAEAAA